MAKAYINRMKKEQKKLHKKINKLIDFIENNPRHKELAGFDQDLLSAQLSAMTTYGNILNIRIERANEQEEDGTWETIEEELFDIPDEIKLGELLEKINKAMQGEHNGKK